MYMIFPALQTVLSIGKTLSWFFLSSLIYWCILSFQVIFLLWGSLRRALLYLSTLTLLLLHLISQVNGVLSVGVFVLCHFFCAKFPFNMDIYLKGVGTWLFRQRQVGHFPIYLQAALQKHKQDMKKQSQQKSLMQIHR